MQLANGVRLGPYQIVAPVAAGGMGEVYRARDTRLDRTVAIKVLPAELARDERLRIRFEREARAISSLSHPHICALYDLGEAQLDGMDEAAGAPIRFLVMEYLEGETLDQRLKKGPMPLDQVLRYGIEIADALDKAHRNQILHRDLKPSNIMITKSGAKLLDFGIAKTLKDPVESSLRSRSQSEGADSSKPSTRDRTLTAEGTVVGTLDHMAPEQLEGKPPDARSEIFALGGVLYRMATGRPPFQGNTDASLVASILEHNPLPLSHYQPLTPPALDWVVRTCLAKDPDERFQTAHDVKLELRRITEIDLPTSRISRSRIRQKPARFILAAAAVVAVLLVIWLGLLALENREPQTTGGSLRRFSISLPPTAPLTSANYERMSVSPDGSRLAYVAGTDPIRLYVYSLEKLEATPLPGTEGAKGPFFSSDGEWIGFYTSDGDLKKVAVTGGGPITIGKIRDLRGATWGSGDVIIFAEPWEPLRRISATGGEAQPVTPRDSQMNVRWPSFLPDGQHVLYTASDWSGDYENAKLSVLSLETGKSRVVVEGATFGRYVPTGHVLYAHSGMIFAAPFDVRALKVSGSPVPLIRDVDSYFASGLAHYAAANDGSLFYLPFSAAADEAELVWVDRTGNVRPLSPSRKSYDDPRLSPDGKRLAVTIGSGPRSDVWVYDIPRDTWSRLTSEATNRTGIWSPDGKQIVFSSNRNRGFNLFLIPSDGSGPPRQITTRRQWPFATSWSPDGRMIAVVEQYRARLTDIFLVPADTKENPQPFLSTAFNEEEAEFSPDGGWIAYHSNDSGRYEVYVQKYPGPGQRTLVSTNGGLNPLWRRDGRELYYRTGNKVMAVEVKTGAQFTLGKPRVLFEGEFDNSYDVTPDGQRFVMIRHTKPVPRTQVSVVLGQLNNLRAR